MKVASYQALNYAEFWALFGEGQYPGFEKLLLAKLSPYLSSQALQYWLKHTSIFTSRAGLYSHGGSGVALKLVKTLLYLTGLRDAAQKMCRARNLSEQWLQWLRLRRVLLSPTLHWLFVNSEFLWKAAGVPAAQAKLITDEYQMQQGPERSLNQTNEGMWQYISDTLDPIARDTLLSTDNFYYFLALNGKYTKRYVQIQSSKHNFENILKICVDANHRTCLDQRSRDYLGQMPLTDSQCTLMKSARSSRPWLLDHLH